MLHIPIHLPNYVLYINITIYYFLSSLLHNIIIGYGGVKSKNINLILDY